MSTLGVIGALAQGYTDAAKQRREQNLALGEHQRDLQINLLDKLLADPSTPEEYKGTLLQQRIATTNANQYDKNGQLKLPSLDDMRQQLPPVQRPATPGPGPAPAIQLPTAPPGMAAAGTESPANASAAPSAALPPSGVQNAPGGPSVPPMLQMPTAPPTLPGTPVAVPTPPPIAEAGQFHPLSHEEQAQREVARLRTIAQSLIAAGVPEQQALVQAGLAPKPEFVHGSFGAPLYNAYTGKPLDQSGSAAEQKRPVGSTVTNFQTPDGIISLQQFRTGDNKTHWEDPSGNVVVPDPKWTKLVPGTLPTVRTNTSKYDAETGTTTSTSTTQKMLPGGVTVQKVRTTFDRPAVATPSAGSPKSNVAKMAEMWATQGTVPNAKDKRQVTAYMNDHGLIPMPKLPAGEAKALTGVYTDLQDANNRLATMQEDLKQIESDPANAGSYDMDLLSQHIALTFGSVKGVRTSQQLIEHHLKARSLPENLAVMAQKVLRGDQLSPEQRANFIHLAQTRAGLADQKYQNLRTNLLSRYGNTIGLTAPTPPPAGGGTIRARDTEGKLHEAPAGTPLPQGWTLEK